MRPLTDESISVIAKGGTAETTHDGQPSSHPQLRIASAAVSSRSPNRSRQRRGEFQAVSPRLSWTRYHGGRSSPDGGSDVLRGRYGIGSDGGRIRHVWRIRRSGPGDKAEAYRRVLRKLEVAAAW